jgi:hypothetical protein
MRVLKLLLAIVAVLAILMGLLWIGQGLGIIMWPASSFMLADRQWAVNGAILAAVGALLLWFARR